MKFTLSSLKNYLETNSSLQEICQKLTSIGLEVESVIDQSQILSEFSVAKIVECKNHENSTKLKVCQVCVDENLPLLQIVCGASNARQGIKVAYAKINSVIPKNQMVIKKAKIAGVESNGMLCSSSELLINDEDEGIIEIDDKFPIKTKISDVFLRNDAIIEIYATPNRADCLGVYGIARDLSACGIGILKNFEKINLKNNFEFNLNITNNASDVCKLIAYRHIKNIKNTESPQWLKEKLTAIDINSINAIIDIGNYVMHLTSQPLHCYDSSNIKGNITIDLSSTKPEFTSLKNQNYLIDDNILTISDEEKILSIAGIIGAKSSGCIIDTTEILLEAGNFNSSVIAFGGRKLNILSESRHRFERGSDPHNCEFAIDLATKMIIEICGNNNSQISNIKKIPSNFEEILTEKIIDFDISLVKKLIGIEIDKKIAIDILTKLGFKVEELNNLLRLTVPSYRNDITISVDIVEELIRIYGFEHILKQPLPSSYNYHTIENNNNKSKVIKNNEINNNSSNKITFNNSVNLNFYLNKVRSKLIDKGLIETINWTFIEDKTVELFCDRDENLLLKNPVSVEMNYLRPTLAIGLINCYKKNSLRNFNNLSLFEIGNIFKNNHQQQISIGALRAGKNCENNHYHDQRDFDVFDIKQDLINTLSALNIKFSSLEISYDNSIRYLHPHRQASFKLGKNLIANFGEIHPLINQEFNLKNRLNFFEIFIDDQLISKRNNNFKAYIANDFPIVERDFAVVVDKDLAVEKLQKTIANVDKNLIKEVNIFDIFTNENIGNDKKSVAFNVKIQDSKTLSGEEIEEICKKIISNLNSNCNATLRG